MDLGLILLLIQSAFRLGVAGRNALEQAARDQAVLLPNTVVLAPNARQLAQECLANNWDTLTSTNKNLYVPHLEGPSRRIKTVPTDSTEIVIALLIADGLWTDRLPGVMASFPTDTVPMILLARQWRKGAGPISPIGQIGLAVLQVGLDFVAARPDIAGVSGNAAALVASVAGQLSQLIGPDVSQTDVKAVFGERLLTAFTLGGLTALAQHPGMVAPNESMAELTKAAVGPLIAGLSTNTESDFRKRLEAAIKPVAHGVFDAVASNPDAYLGRDLRATSAIGAITREILVVAANDKDRAFSAEGLNALLTAAARVAAAKPELFVATADGPPGEFRMALFKRTMSIIGDGSMPFSRETGLGVAASAIEVLSANAVGLLETDEKWAATVSDAVRMIAEGFKDGLGAQNTPSAAEVLKKHLTPTQVKAFARRALVQIGARPEMLIATDKNTSNYKELQCIVAAMAKAIAADKNFLLTGDDWVALVGIAAEEAALNPGPLFGFDPNDTPAAAAQLVLVALVQAANEVTGRERVSGRVVRGAILRELLVITLRAMGGRLKPFLEATLHTQLGELLRRLSVKIETSGYTLGGKECTILYEAMLRQLLKGGTLDAIFAPDNVERILKGEVK